MDLGEENASMLSGRQTPHSAVSLASMSSTTENMRPELIDSAQLPNNTNITDPFGKFDIGTNIDRKRAGNPGKDPRDYRPKMGYAHPYDPFLSPPDRSVRPEFQNFTVPQDPILPYHNF